MADTGSRPSGLPIYDSLNVKTREIRILSILSSPSPSTLQCKLEKTSLLDPTTYAALSYCWGNPEDTTTILVNDVPTLVTVNLADALRQLGKMGVVRVWADALCINQADKQERGHQVLHMNHVYSKATTTYAWLGRGTSHDSLGIVQLRQWIKCCTDTTLCLETSHLRTSTSNCGSQAQVSAEEKAEMASEISTSEYASRNLHAACERCVREFQYMALWRFFSCEYWRRRWIIQELVVAPQVMILWGSLELGLKDLEIVMTRSKISAFWSPGLRTASMPLETVFDIRRRYQEGNKLSLLAISYESRSFQSKEPHDKLYALHGICDDWAELTSVPDYSLEPEAIARQVTRALIWKTKRLDAILINSLTVTSTNLPSWAPDWLRAEPLPWEAYKLGSLRSSLSRLLIPSPEDGVELSSNVLSVRGAVLATIKDATSPFRTSIIVHREELLENRADLFKTKTKRSLERLSPTYYYDEAWLMDVITACLTIESRRFIHLITGSRNERSMRLYAMQRQIFDLVHSDTPQISQHNVPESGESTEVLDRRAFCQWLILHRDFWVDGRNLEEWLQYRYSRYIRLHFLDSGWGYFVTFIQAIAPFGLPVIIWWRQILPKYRLEDPNDPGGPVTADSAFPKIMLGVVGFMASVLTVIFFVARLCKFVKWKRRMREARQQTQKVIPPTSRQQVRASRRLITTMNGLLGTTTFAVEAGDKICFIAGCDKPIVLRQVQATGRVQYRVVGTCSIYLCLEPATPDVCRDSLLNLLNSEDYLNDPGHIITLLGHVESGVLKVLELV